MIVNKQARFTGVGRRFAADARFRVCDNSFKSNPWVRTVNQTVRCHEGPTPTAASGATSIETSSFDSFVSIRKGKQKRKPSQQLAPVLSNLVGSRSFGRPSSPCSRRIHPLHVASDEGHF